MAGYGTDQGFADWLTANGHELPDDAPPPAVLRQRGSVYVDGTYGPRFPGSPTGGASQEREWPRTDATDRYGNEIGASTVPTRVIEASYQAAWIEAGAAGTLATTYTPGTQKVLTEVKGIKWQVVGKPDGERAMVPISTVIEGLLAPLLIPAYFPSALVV